MFDPIVGRWLSEDRLGFKSGDLNLYRYCNNDPINHTDPSGDIVFVPTNEKDRLIESFKKAYGLEKDDITYLYWQDEGLSALFVPKERRKRLTLAFKDVLDAPPARFTTWDRGFMAALATFRPNSNKRYISDPGTWNKSNELPNRNIDSYANTFYKTLKDLGWLEGIDVTNPEAYVQSTTLGVLCQNIKDDLKNVTEFVTEFYAFAEAFADKVLRVAGALITRPEEIFKTFVNGTKDGFTTFLEKLPERLPAILFNWLTDSPADSNQTNSFTFDGLAETVLNRAGLGPDVVWGRFASQVPQVRLILQAEALLDQSIESLLKVAAGTEDAFTKLLSDPLVDGLKQQVFQALTEKLIQSVAGGVPAMFDLGKAFFANAKAIAAVVTKLVEAVDPLLKGKTEGVAMKVDEGLVKVIPAVLGFAASFLKIQPSKTIDVVVEKVKQPANKLVDKAAMFVANKVSGLKLSKPDRDVIGEVKRFQYKGKQHELWLEKGQQGVELHVASDEGRVLTPAASVQAAYDELQKAIKDAQNDPAKQKGKAVGGKVKALSTAAKQFLDAMLPAVQNPDAVSKVKVMVVRSETPGGPKVGSELGLKEFLEGGCSVKGQCFGGETEVWLAGGRTRMIALLRPGLYAETWLPGEFGYSQSCRLAHEYIDPLRHRIFWFMLEGDGFWVRFGLLRSWDWLNSQGGGKIGDKLRFDMPEMGVVGDAQLMQIDRCSEIVPGVGRLMTGWFEHSAGKLWRLEIEGMEEPIRGTGNHPIFSVDRLAWVALGELKEGEAVQVRGGVARVRGITETDFEGRVYNIEVWGDHCYRVGELGLLVHNNSTQPASGIPESTDCYFKLCEAYQKASPGEVSKYILDAEFKKSQEYAHKLACRFVEITDQWIRDQKKPRTAMAVAVALVCDFQSGKFMFWVSTTYAVAAGTTHPIQAAMSKLGDPSYRFIPPKLMGPHAESNIVEETNNGRNAHMIGVAANLLICRGCQGQDTPPAGGRSLPAGTEFLSPVQSLGQTHTPSSCM